jgi:2'-5' RNA ligase
LTCIPLGHSTLLHGSASIYDCEGRVQGRWFIALMVPKSLSEGIQNIIKDLTDRYKTRVSTAGPHITLVPPFEATGAELAGVCSSLRSWAEMQVPTRVELDGFGAFGKRVLFVDVEHAPGLMGLQNSLETQVRQENDFLPAPRKPFIPHVSVASKRVRKDTFEIMWIDELKDKEFTGSWLATNVTLLKFKDGVQWVEDQHFELAGDDPTESESA